MLTRRTSEETELYLEYREIKTQLASMSMVEEFAKYAKLQRKSIKLKESLSEKGTQSKYGINYNFIDQGNY
jgi:hypothetical protein